MKKLLALVCLIASIVTFATTAFAGNPDTIRACGNLGFTKNRDLNICMKSGADAEAVIACAKIGTSDMTLINECITSGAPIQKIRNCVQTNNDLDVLSACLKS